MSAKLIDGRALAEKVYGDIRGRVQALKGRGIYPKLAIIRVGQEPASALYVRMKSRRALALGITVEHISYPGDIATSELLAAIQSLNQDSSLSGILVQLPLPHGVDSAAVLEAIAPEKDVDGLRAPNMGALCLGQSGLFACTPRGIIKLIESTGLSIAGKQAVVVGRSDLVGKPTALMLLERDATVSICHTKTENLAAITQNADILVAAAGCPGLIKGDMVKPGALVIDVGQTMVEGAWRGDTDFEAVSQRASYITPPTGGVGPMTIAMLMDNIVEAAERFEGY